MVRARAGAGGFVLLVLWFLLVVGSPAWAYRPFVSTDAAVADPGAMEIELGYFQFARQRHEDVFSTPKVVLNYGVVDRLEVVGEFAVEQAPHEDWQLVDPGLSLKALLKKGVLQDTEGLSIAVEAGPLFPSTNGAEGLGFEASGIVSGRLQALTYHVNFGGGVDRVDARPFALWGLIAETPVVPTFRLVGELNGESVEGERANNSVLLGFIWQPFLSRELWIDGGIRRGITRAAPDWQATLGLTFAFPVTSRARGVDQPGR
jgi:hypothetical protein